MLELDTSSAPPIPGSVIAPTKPALLQTTEHHLCAGCGEPVVLRLIAELIEEMGLAQRSVGVVGHGCYGSFVTMLDVDILQCLHWRAPSCATGIKRMRPECMVFTMTGDGDMVNEGLQEVLHTAARGEKVTAILMNNGVFGDTGGHMTAATVLGQRTKTSLEGRDADYHGYPIPIADLVARLDGASFVARAAVHNAGVIAQAKRLMRRAIEHQLEGRGFGLLEVLTMCPTGWFVEPAEGPDYMIDTLEQTYPLGVLKSERREPGIPANSERGPSGPAAEPPRAER